MILKKIKKVTRNIISFFLALFLTNKLRTIQNQIKQKHLILSIYAHNPKKKIFKKTIVWLLKHGYTFITIEKLYNILENKLTTNKLVWLSFDDGWKGNIYNTLPVLIEYNIPATFFISTKAVEDGYLWFDIAIKHRFLLPVSLKELWKMENKRRHYIINELIDKHKSLIEDKEVMNIKDVISISKSRLLSIGNHTDDHVLCTNCEKLELKNEITKCSKKLINWTGVKPKVFAYPNGKYNESVKEIIKNDFLLAFTTEPRQISINDDWHVLPRAGMMNEGCLLENLCHIFGIWQPTVKKIKLKITRK